MKKKLDKKNIIFLTIDALRADRIGFMGYHRPTTPNLDKLSKNAIIAENCFSLVGHTQGSFPTIFSSTKPLSFGGYDHGVKNRPNILPEVLQKYGYETYHLLTFPWLSSRFGYGRGVTNLEHYYSIKGIVGSTVTLFISDIGHYLNGKLSDEEILAIATPHMEEGFKYILEYCDYRLNFKDRDNNFFKYSNFVQEGFNFNKVKSITLRHEAEFKKAPLSYLKKHIFHLPRQCSHLWLSQEFKYHRTFSNLIEQAYKHAKINLVKNFNPDLALLIRNEQKAYADTSELISRIKNVFENKKSDKPIYLWTHLLETHVPYISGRAPSWYKETPKYLKKLGYDEKINPAYILRDPKKDKNYHDWSMFYDAALSFIDEQIGHLIDYLEQTRQLENTIIVIAGDHGEELGEHGDIGHHMRLYEENIKVPLMIFDSSLKETRIKSLSSLADLAPSILETIGVSSPQSYIGTPLQHLKEREFIQFETFNFGNCTWGKRPVYMGIRTLTHKYIWREAHDPNSIPVKDQFELFDLQNDYQETKNLYTSSDPLIKKFNKILAERLQEIPEYMATAKPEILNNLLN